MHDNHLFEYAVIRVMPRVEREEFLNVGVILYCQKHRFLQMMYTLDATKIHALCEKVDTEEIEEHLQAFDKICRGAADGGPIAQLELPLRFRWLTAARSTVVQTSRVHPGLCVDPAETLKKLHAQLVL